MYMEQLQKQTEYDDKEEDAFIYCIIYDVYDDDQDTRRMVIRPGNTSIYCQFKKKYRSDNDRRKPSQKYHLFRHIILIDDDHDGDAYQFQ